MNNKRLGTLEVFSLALGCMGMTGFYGKANREECKNTIALAFESGITFFDTADNYGFGENEILLGQAIAPFRNKISVATKVGVVQSRESPNGVALNGTKKYIKEACTASLKRLNVSSIDLYYLHHVDPKTPVEVSVEAMAELVYEGKVRHVGLGETGEENIRRAHQVYPITAIQAEYSLFSRDAEKQILPLCKELNIGFVACAPLSRGLLSGKIASFNDLKLDDFRRMFPRFESSNLVHNFKIVSALIKFAEKKSCTLSQLALAWILAQSSSIVPLFGTTISEHVRENISSGDISLSGEEINAMNEIISRGALLGARYPEMAKQFYVK